MKLSFEDFKQYFPGAKTKECTKFIQEIWGIIWNGRERMFMTIDHLNMPPYFGVAKEINAAFCARWEKLPPNQRVMINQAIGRIVIFICTSFDYKKVSPQKVTPVPPKLTGMVRNTKYFEPKYKAEWKRTLKYSYYDS